MAVIVPFSILLEDIHHRGIGEERVKHAAKCT